MKRSISAFILLLWPLLAEAQSRPTPEEAIAVWLRCCGSRSSVAVSVSADGPRSYVIRVSPPAPRARVIADVPWSARVAVPWRHVAPAPDDPTVRHVRVTRAR